ncbi:MAG: ATPase [Desulfosarcina sp.]|nr:ATPase [Desulfosarcina sp.]
MTDVPVYFEEVRCRAARRWEQLEQDPVLAGPWHQLFKQVQSPRHVVSELLQNADDAGATMASVGIQDGDFVFTHNGEDFIEEHFTSLCRFGYSNKRALHTIGFRGVGFKSTFSLGDEVRLNTPSLSVAFCRERFTEPVWQTRNGMPASHTEIRVAIRDDHRLRELEKNLEDWTKSPASLLFFRSIRCLIVRRQEIRWEAKSPGPIADSHWMALASDSDRQFLLIQSSPEAFPEEALEEIRQERMVAVDEETSFPPCKIEIVLGLEGRLFVILPTGVKTELPFACNAPFIQDPARVKIKDPETSPTNRWILKRVGKLATKAMLEWLGRNDLDIKQRCKAYALLSDLNREDHSIEGNCGRIVQESCETTLANKPYLITEDGSFEKEKGCIALPSVLLDVWSLDQVVQLFSEGARPILSRYVISAHRRKLINLNCCDEFGKEYVLDTLISKHLPKPESWAKLLWLWDYIADDIVGYPFNRKYKNVQIFPVQGKDILFSASKVVRLGEKKLLQSQEDWQFLDDYLLVLNQNWPRYLAEQRRKAEQDKNWSLERKVKAAYKVLDDLGLGQAGDVSQVIQQVANKFFGQEDCDIEDCIRLAQIAASLGASASEKFQFVTWDGYRKPVSDCIVADIHNDLDVIVPDHWYKGHVLHEDYRVLLSCTEEEWRQWVASGRSRLLTFVPLIKTEHRVWNRNKIRRLLRERGFDGVPLFPYKSDNFTIKDWDFDEEHLNFWMLSAKDDPEFWSRIFTRILAQPKEYWIKSLSAKVWQNGNKYRQSVTHEVLMPSWIIKFSDLPCLQDTRGNYRHPAELLRRTPDTESLLDVEPFVRAELDTETTRQLLVMLGVRDTPTGPDRLLDRLRALSTVDDPPVNEVEKWCRRLDHISARCSTDEFQEIRGVFTHEKLILTTDSEWVYTSEVFLNADEEDAPCAAVVHSAIQDLALWRKVGVAERPTGDLALKWLAGIPSNRKLSKNELRRVRALLPRYAERIWLECRHWLNLDGVWAPVEELVYKLTMQTLIPWANLFRPIKQKTADFQKLTAEMCGQYPFAKLPTLVASIEDRFEDKIVELEDAIAKQWLASLGSGLARVVLDNEVDSQRTRELGRRLMHTQWQVVAALETTPYIDGTPSGTPRRIDVLWKDTTLYVKSKSIATMAKAVAQELGRAFGRVDIVDSIKLCLERDPAFVTEYMEANFKLLPPEEVTAEESSKPNQEDANVSSEETVVTTPTDSETCDAAQSTDEATESSQPIPDADDSKATDDVSSDDQGEPNSDEEEHGGDAPAPPNRPKRPAKPKLIERYAKTRGFIKDNGEGRYYHEDGGWIERISGASFPWERYSSSGELQQCYWTKDHCIEREPLQLEADVWELCDKHPEKYTLLLAGPDGTPVEYSGHRIRELRNSGRLTLFPANYRLVLDSDKDA